MRYRVQPGLVALGLAVLLAGLGGLAFAEEQIVYEPAVLTGPAGESVTLPLSPDIFRTYPERVRDSGRSVLQSNNPEYVTEAGILYRDTVDGKARLNLYHATRSERPMHYSIILHNRSQQDVTVTITRRGVAGPSTNYPKVGQDVLAAFWSAVLDERVLVPAGEQRHLDFELVQYRVGYNQLLHGRYDIETDGPLDVVFVADDVMARLLEPDVSHYDEFTLPPSARMRGTYAISERYVTMEAGERPVALVLAGNRPPDLYLYGTDGMDGTTRQNYGNFGITYHVDVLMQVSQPQKIRFYIGPAFGGGGSCFLRPVLLLTEGEHDDHAEQGRVLRLPSSRDQRTVGFVGETVVLPEQPRILRFDFMPPGGSCLPALFFAEPEAIALEDAVSWHGALGRD